MIIANPIYDIVFKRLMENRRVARFFVETLIGEQVDEIAVVPQEYTYQKKIRKKKPAEKQGDDTNDSEIFSLIRFDFVATIRSATGEHKKVLIEIQKSQKPTDLIRFRTYLGEQYKRTDMVHVKTGKVEKALPIITIYLLGFKIPKIRAKAIKVDRTYRDIIDQKEIRQKSKLIEALTHDGYFVQIPLIKGKPRTLLEKLLSVFEQEYFIDEKNISKEYEHPVDNEIIGEMLEILRHTAADPKERRALEEAYWASQDEEEYEKVIKALETKEKELEVEQKRNKEKDKALEESKKEIESLKLEIKRLQLTERKNKIS